MQPPDGGPLWSPGPSLWSLIAEHAPGSEQRRVRSALGCSLIDAYEDVHAEATAWHKMWQEGLSRAGTPLQPRRAPLADPPAIKELVRAEVRMMLESLRERAAREGRRDEEFLCRYEAETVNFALGRPGSTASESRAGGGAQRSARPAGEDEIKALKDQLNIADIDRVVDRIRSVLTEECEALKTQVSSMQGSIKKHLRSPCGFAKREPTLADLKELRGAIQADFELYPSSPSSAPPPLTARTLTNTVSPSPGQRSSGGSWNASVGGPYPPPAPHQPRPPPGPPLIKQGNAQTTSRSIASRHRNLHLPASEPAHRRTGSPEQGSAGLRSKASACAFSFPSTTLRNAPVQGGHPSSHRSANGPRSGCDSSLQMERKSSRAPRSEHIQTLSSHQAGSCERGYRGDITGGSATEEGPQKSSCGVAGKHSVSSLSESRAPSDTTEGNNAIHANKNRQLREDVSRRRPEGSGGAPGWAAHTRPTLIQIDRHCFASMEGPLGGSTSQAKSLQEEATQQEFVHTFLQPVPPRRVMS